MRGETRMSALTPLAAWDRFEADHSLPWRDPAYVVITAALSSEWDPSKLDVALRVELTWRRAHDFPLVP